MRWVKGALEVKANTLSSMQMRSILTTPSMAISPSLALDEDIATSPVYESISFALRPSGSGMPPSTVP